MKKSNLFLLTIAAFLSAVLFDMVLGLQGVGVILAFAVVSAVPDDTVTTRRIDTASPELLEDVVSKKIVEMKPSLYPIDTISRHINRTVTAPSWRYGYYAVDTRAIRDTMRNANNVVIPALGGAVLPNSIYEILVTNMHVWQVDDNIAFLNATGVNNQALIGNIVRKNNAAGSLHVMLINRRSTGFSIPNTCKLVRIGNSKSELDAQTSPYAMLPFKEFNYSQIHMTQVEESVYAKLHDKEVQWGMADYQAQAIYDLRRSMELTSLVGARGVLVDPEDEQQKYFSGGLMTFITNYIDVPTTGITNNWFVDATERIFSDNSGSDTRFLFAGNKLISDLSKVPDIKKQIDAKNVEVLYGITFSKIETIFGVLLIRHHKLLTEVGEIATGVVLDMNNVERAVFKKMEARKLLLKDSGQRNADAHVVDEAFCLALLYPDTHALIGPPR